MRILVTGASGFIGGELIPLLLTRGHSVVALTRKESSLKRYLWKNQVTVVEGDLLEPSDSLAEAFKDVDIAYYLVHSMTGSVDFEQLDKIAVQHFVDLGKGLKHVIYLGGIKPVGEKVSSHLRSRLQVGEILSKHLPTTEFRAGPIIGSGSSSFEMIRYLTERLPVMTAPRWILHDVQPIGLDDMLRYLLETVDHEPLGIVDVGGDVLSFKATMEVYARERGLTRWVLPLPVLAPGLAALWVGFVTPISNKLAVPLIQGVVHSITSPTDKAQKLFPHIKPINYEAAVRLTLLTMDGEKLERTMASLEADEEEYEKTDWEGVFRERYRILVTASNESIFKAVSRIGGEAGWYRWNWAWQLRGFIDRVLGGPGMGHGRSDPNVLKQGETLDFWRVVRVDENKRIQLRAEMKLPGKAWLQWEIMPKQYGCYLTQTAIFQPKGFWGHIYWKCLEPFHAVIFKGMIEQIAQKAEYENEEG